MRMVPSGISVAAGQSITVAVAVESNSGNGTVTLLNAANWENEA